MKVSIKKGISIFKWYHPNEIHEVEEHPISTMRSIMFRDVYTGLGIEISDCEIIREESQPHQFIPYQLCPKCNGEGRTMSSPVHTTTIYSLCDVCNGAKIIPMHKVT